MNRELDEAFWVDFLEGELEPSMKEDMELLLAHSEQHRDIVYGIENVRAALKSVDDVELPQDGNYYLDQHDKIMNEIAKVKVEPPRRTPRLKWTKLPQYLMMLGIFALAVAVASSMFMNTKGPEQHTAEEQIKKESLLKASLPLEPEEPSREEKLHQLIDEIEQGSDPNETAP